MSKRAYRVSLTLTALVEAHSQSEANEVARKQLDAALKQLERMPDQEPLREYQRPVYQPKKRATNVAPVPSHNQPREFVTWPHK